MVGGRQDPPRDDQRRLAQLGDQVNRHCSAGLVQALVRRKPLARGHRCPSASMGPPQNGHEGRPAATSDSARVENDRAIGAGSRTRRSLLRLGLLDRQVDQPLLVGLQRRLDLDLRHREDLDHDPLVCGVPGQRDRARAELLDQRLLEGLVVDHGDRGHRRDRRAGLVGGDQLVEQLGDAFPEDLHLLLLQRHRRHLGTDARLEEEGALAGLADGPGHESLGRVEAVDDRHGPRLDGG